MIHPLIVWLLQAAETAAPPAAHHLSARDVIEYASVVIVSTGALIKSHRASKRVDHELGPSEEEEAQSPRKTGDPSSGPAAPSVRELVRTIVKEQADARVHFDDALLRLDQRVEMIDQRALEAGRSHARTEQRIMRIEEEQVSSSSERREILTQIARIASHAPTKRGARNVRR